MDEFQKLFYQETKDFHGRLCALEEKYLKTSSAKKTGRPTGSRSKRSK